MNQTIAVSLTGNAKQRAGSSSLPRRASFSFRYQSEGHWRISAIARILPMGKLEFASR